MSPANGASDPSSFLAELYRIDVDSDQSQLLVSGGMEAALSPDGQKLVVAMIKGTSRELMVANADGSDLRSLNVKGSSPIWSPDGQWIVYQEVPGKYASSSGDISMIRPDGTDLHSGVVVSPINRPVWSPDGKFMLTQAGKSLPASSWLAKTSMEDGKIQLIPMKMFDNTHFWQLLGWAAK
jgi:Tol biopolymer transport system component